MRQDWRLQRVGVGDGRLAVYSTWPFLTNNVSTTVMFRGYVPVLTSLLKFELSYNIDSGNEKSARNCISAFKTSTKTNRFV